MHRALDHQTASVSALGGAGTPGFDKFWVHNAGRNREESILAHGCRLTPKLRSPWK